MNPQLSTRIAGQLKASLAPVDPIPSPVAFTIRSLAVFVVLAVVLVIALGARGIRAMNGLELAGIGALFAAGASFFSLTMSIQTTPAARRRFRSSVVTLVFIIAAVAGIVVLFPWRFPDTSLTLSWQCSLRELAIAIPAAVVFGLLLRRAVVLSPVAMGASVGAFAGPLAVTGLQFTCVYQEAVHLLVWHWSILAITTGAGAPAARFIANMHRRA